VDGSRAAFLLVGTHGLAVDGDDIGGNAGQRADPGNETSLEGFGIERRQDVAEVVMRRRSKLGTRPCEAGMGSLRRGAVLERPEAAQKRALLLPERGNVDDRLGSRQHGQQAQQQDLVQRIHHLAALPWIRQIT